MKKKVSLVLMLVMGLSSCGIIENAIPVYNKLEIINESKYDITILSFENNIVIDSIFLTSKGTFARLVDELDFLDHPLIFSSLLIDSVSITNNEAQGVFLYCSGEPLLSSLIACPELESSIIHLAYNGKNQDVRLREDGKRVRQLYSFVYDDSDFQ